MSVHIRARAIVDIDDQAEHLGLTSPEVAHRFLVAVARTLKSIETMPGAGSSLGSLEPALQNLRYWVVRKFKKHLIIYRPVEGGIDVLRVLHGARNIAKALEDG
jgi:toxin ParE1/3/4